MCRLLLHGTTPFSIVADKNVAIWLPGRIIPGWGIIGVKYMKCGDLRVTPAPTIPIALLLAPFFPDQG